MLITIDGWAKQQKTDKRGQAYLPVHLPDGRWLNLYAWDGFKPAKGMTFDVDIKSSAYRTPDGEARTSNWATIIGPAPKQAAPVAPPQQWTPPPPAGVHTDNPTYGHGPTPPPAPQSAPTGQPGPATIGDGFTRTYPAPTGQPGGFAAPIPQAKTTFADWSRLVSVTWALGVSLGIPPAECVGFLQTTLITFRDGKLELPVADTGAEGPISGDEFDWAKGE